MQYEEIQDAFACTAFLLSYPNQEWRDTLYEARETAITIEHRQIQAGLLRFLDLVETLSVDDLIDIYVHTFDFGKKTNMYLTYLQTGEQRERGIELLEIKQHYKKSGFDVTERELPDYLPLMVEFASLGDQSVVTELLTKYKSNIEHLRKNLIDNENIYVVVIDCILMAIEMLQK